MHRNCEQCGSEFWAKELQRIVTAKTSSQRDVFRARIILGLAKELSHKEISQEQGVSLLAIGRWRKRWAAKGENKAAAARRKGLAPLTEIFRVQEASPRSRPSTGSPFVKSLGMAPISFTFARRSGTLSTT